MRPVRMTIKSKQLKADRAEGIGLFIAGAGLLKTASR